MEKAKGSYFKIENIVLFTIFAFILLQKAPLWWSLFKEEDKRIAEFTIEKTDGTLQKFPHKEKSILIFWSMDCAPCKIELQRIDAAVLDNKISKNQVHALHIQDLSKDLISNIKKQNYSFPTYIDKEGILNDHFKVFATPTIYFLNEEGIVYWSTMGISPLLILKIQHFLKP